MLSRTTDFVKFFDSQVTDFKRVNNENDLVPIVPDRFLGFSHPQGEIVRASSQRNDSTDEDNFVRSKTVPSILSGNVLHHSGPYNGIFIGSVFCN
ncbi:hypothetical protein B0H14DRAFT_2390909 [Mycena olivaceomarginata]|nr:hypothetical protein B0H14DRAFT_2390909 [Mycena olivaceomarginata]